MKLRVLIAAAAVLGVAACSSDRSDQSADLILTDGIIVTLEDALGEQQALASRDGRILAVGSNEEIAALADGDTRVINLEGRTVIPGFIEGHGHFMGLGASRMVLDLRTPESWDQIVGMVAEAASTAEPGAWILGRGWHQDKWTAPPSPALEGFPLGFDLAEASPDNPVILKHASGHASFANAAALKAAGITRDTPNPPGGEILRDASGRATGLLRETAQRLVESAYSRENESAASEATMRRAAELAASEVVAKGITTFHDAGVAPTTIDFYRTLADEGALPLRLWVMIAGQSDSLEAMLTKYRTIGYGDGHLTVRAIKLSMDCALGSRGAWMLEPYSDAPDLTGLNLIPVDYVQSTAELARKHDFQLCVHAIGDRANREVLDVYEEVLGSTENDRRWRIEHAQHLNPDEVPRFARLGVIASMQAVHCTSDGPWVPSRIGDDRAEEGAYVWQKLMQSGAIVTNGTDTPVEDIDPVANYYSSVTRRMINGETFYPDQKMTRLEALRSYTINNAIAGVEENDKGTLRPGKLADLVVLSQNILEVPVEEIRTTMVDYTIVGGRVVHERSGAER